MRAEKHYVEFIELLNRHKVRYVIVGAFAVSYYSRPRNTGDIDFFLDRSKTNAQKMLLVLKDFGFESVSLTIVDLMEPDQIIQLGFEPNRIDLITSISGVSFDEAWENADEGTLGTEKTYFISLEHLIQNKMATNRKRDLADVEVLNKLKNK